MGKQIKVNNEWMVGWTNYCSRIINKVMRFFSYVRMMCGLYLFHKGKEGRRNEGRKAITWWVLREKCEAESRTRCKNSSAPVLVTSGG